MCMCACVYIKTYMYIYLSLSIYIYIYTYMYTYISEGVPLPARRAEDGAFHGRPGSPDVVCNTYN